MNLDLELCQVGLAKQQLDAEVVPRLEEEAGQCEKRLEHLLGVLQGALHASAHVSAHMAESMRQAADETAAASALAVVAMNQLLAHVQELSEEMKPAAEVAAQVKQISATLTVLEKAAKKLEKQQLEEK